MAAGSLAGIPDNMERNRESNLEVRLGCRVWCKTVFNEEFEGEVIAFDNDLSAMVLKTPSVSTTPSKGGKRLNDVHVINMKCIPEGNFKILSLGKGGHTVPIDIDHEKIERRLRHALVEKTRAVEKIGIGVTPEAQLLFDYLSNLYRDCNWNENCIVVMDDVTVSPPYGPENCSGVGQESLERIQKMVAKFHNDRHKTKEET